MYVLRELEDALDDCAASDPTRNADQVLALDEAVAFYTGSLEGTTGTGEGVFIYSLANKRCINFKTCGPNGDQIEGTAKVNLDIFTEFNKMKQNLAAGSSNCNEARTNKEAIAKKLFVPMIQGTLRYAYKQDQPDTNAIAEAEGAIFAAAVLPIVDKCNPNSAATIFNEMMPNSGNTADFASVKRAFEDTYSCMGITCADVGGVYDTTTQSYSEGASPCEGSGSDGGSKAGLAIGLSVGALIVVALVILFVKGRGKSSVEFKSDGTSHV
jgi:Low iron-inducible periplasmic protein